MLGALDLDQRRPGELRGEEAQHRGVQALPPELGRERGDLGRRRRLDAEDVREQRHPHGQVATRRAAPLPQRGEGLAGGGSPSDAQDPAQQDVHGAYGTLAVCASQAARSTSVPPGAARARTSAASRVLPTPASPTTSTSPPRPSAASASNASTARSSSSRPCSGSTDPASGAPTRALAGAPTDQAWTGFAFPLPAKGSSATQVNLVAERSRMPAVA